MDPSQSIGVDSLVQEIRNRSYMPQRDIDKPTIFSVDHCFSIRGQGTVMTGTILQGKISVNDVSWSFLFKQFALNISQHK